MKNWAYRQKEQHSYYTTWPHPKFKVIRSWSRATNGVTGIVHCPLLLAQRSATAHSSLHTAEKPSDCAALVILNYPKGTTSTRKACQRKPHLDISFSGLSNPAWSKELPVFSITTDFMRCLTCILDVKVQPSRPKLTLNQRGCKRHTAAKSKLNRDCESYSTTVPGYQLFIV